jgi:hypothetical protein
MAFLTKLCKILIITLFFLEKRQFFAENWQKLQKFLIVTLTPDLIFCRGVLHKQSFVGSRCGAAEG